MPQSMHTTLPPISSQLHLLMQQEWEQEVLHQLPANVEQQARSLGAFVRVNHLTNVGDLLRGLLAYVLCAPSFRHVGAWAVLTGLTNISHVAWQKRLRKSRDFLLWVVSQLLAGGGEPARVASTRIILVDGTRLKEPGGTGDDWRLHLAYDLTGGLLADVKVSDCHTAEGLTLFSWRARDICIADRGYSRRGQLAFVMRGQADVIIRMAVQQFPLLDEQGQPFDVLQWLKTCKSGQHACPVAFEDDGERFFGRLIVSSLPKEAAEKAREKERKKAYQQQREIREETLYLCGWLVVFTSLPAPSWSDEQVLSLYRARWQIELFIKRMKQLLKLTQLRGKTALTNEATILTLLLAWCLQQSEVESLRETLTKGAEEWAHSQKTEAAVVSAAKPAVVSAAKPGNELVLKVRKKGNKLVSQTVTTRGNKLVSQTVTTQGGKKNSKKNSKKQTNQKGAWQETEQGAWQDAGLVEVVTVPIVSSWTTTALGVQTLRLFVQGFWSRDRLHECLPFLSRFLCSRRRQRKHQESSIRHHLLAHLAQMNSDSSLPSSA